VTVPYACASTPGVKVRVRVRVRVRAGLTRRGSGLGLKSGSWFRVRDEVRVVVKVAFSGCCV